MSYARTVYRDWQAKAKHTAICFTDTATPVTNETAHYGITFFSTGVSFCDTACSVIEHRVSFPPIGSRITVFIKTMAKRNSRVHATFRSIATSVCPIQSS